MQSYCALWAIEDFVKTEKETKTATVAYYIKSIFIACTWIAYVVNIISKTPSLRTVRRKGDQYFHTKETRTNRSTELKAFFASIKLPFLAPWNKNVSHPSNGVWQKEGRSSARSAGEGAYHRELFSTSYRRWPSFKLYWNKTRLRDTQSVWWYKSNPWRVFDVRAAFLSEHGGTSDNNLAFTSAPGACRDDLRYCSYVQYSQAIENQCSSFEWT